MRDRGRGPTAQVMHHLRQRMDPQSSCTRTTTKRKGQKRSEIPKGCEQFARHVRGVFRVGDQPPHDERRITWGTKTIIHSLHHLNELVSAKLLHSSRQWPSVCVLFLNSARGRAFPLGSRNPVWVVRCSPLEMAPSTIGLPCGQHSPIMMPTCKHCQLQRGPISRSLQ